MRHRNTFFLLLLVFFTAGVLTCFSQTHPELTLENSIKIAQEELAKVKFDTSNHYIFSIILTNSSKGSFWYYTYRPYNPSQYKEFFMKIYMDGTCETNLAKAPRGGYVK